MNLTERIEHATHVLAFNAPTGSIFEQTQKLLGKDCDHETIALIESMASSLGEGVFDNAIRKGYSPEIAVPAAEGAIFIAALAVGKRLGIEEGMEMPSDPGAD